MAVYRVGSSGDEVKQIQRALGISDDGKYGQQTKNAVIAYQQKNGLQVDGVVGNETWGSLFGNTQSNATTQSTTQNTTQSTVQSYAPQYTSTDYNEYTYDPSNNEAYQRALAALEQANKNTPIYNPSYDAQLEELYNKIVNREGFTYDLNADMLYDQYRNQYTKLGQQAMQDTMGQAAALTGGYSSSYSQNAGQQAYNQYLTQLNDIVPDLYNQAYGRYQDEGTAMQNQYAMLGDMADDEYNKYMDSYNQWLTNLQMAREDVDTSYDRGYTDFINAVQMAYQKDRDAIADQQWAQQLAVQQQQWAEELAYQKQRDAVADSQWAQELAARYTSDDTGGVEEESAGTDVSGYDPDDLYYVGNNIYSKSAGQLVGFVDENAAALASITEVRKDLNAVKSKASRSELRTMIMQSGLTEAEKTKLIKEYCT